MDQTVEKKKVWRRMIVELFRLIPREARRQSDMQLSAKVREYVARSGAKTLLGFSPMLDEPDLSAFYRRWLAEKGRLALPVWLGGDRMLMRLVDDLDRQLRPGKGGILEPMEELPEIGEESLDMVVTPGRAFSETCARLGRGAGCYDSLFRRHPMVKFGVAYDFQVFPDLPTYHGDVPLDLVLTPSRKISAGA